MKDAAVDCLWPEVLKIRDVSLLEGRGKESRGSLIEALKPCQLISRSSQSKSIIARSEVALNQASPYTV